MKTPIAGLGDFAALDPFFRIIEQGLVISVKEIYLDECQATAACRSHDAGQSCSPKK